MLSGNVCNKTEALLLLDATPMSLGTSLIGDKMSNIIDRGTAIPIKMCKTYATSADNQTKMEIDVYEGEQNLCKNNHLLGVFTLMGISPAPKGVAKIEITLEVDGNGILNVSAVNKADGNSDHITVSITK